MAFDLATSIAGDFLLFDGLELVTYTHRAPDAAPVVTANVRALGREFVGREVGGDSGAATDVRERVWHLKAGDLPAGQECVSGDTITRANGEVWVVGEDNRLQTLGVRWRLGDCTRAAQ